MKLSTLGAMILVIEDEVHVRERVSRSLRQQGFQVEEADRRDKIFAVVDAGRCDAIVLDLSLPGDDGIDIAKVIRTRSDIPILMLTGRAGIHARVLGLEAGADDYLVKPFATEELVARVRAILRRTQKRSEPLGQPIAIELGPVRLDLLSGVITGSGTSVHVTERESRLLLALARSKGILSREATYREVFQREWDAADRSLDVHITHLRRKLESAGAGSGGVIGTVRGQGYELRGPVQILTSADSPMDGPAAAISGLKVS